MNNYIAVTVIDPDNAEYLAKVDTEASDHVILRDLVAALKLPKGDYRLANIGGTRLKDGATIAILKKASQTDREKEIDFTED